ncbi:ParB/RepB/Spo0J family partition protein [Bradyrhizobium genosp. A]|uniref:ParB/RepB/Spo0J family partition protein n=1 Tax=Bradyrhizobium genosp. A TaxID=83626 RepID=UPI003CF501AA
MHPADEYEAFAELHNEQGMSAEDIGARFGVTASVVRQRLKLGAVSPALLKLYREGEMNLEQLTAFTITDDHARQEQVWAGLGYDPSRRAILRALTEGQISADDRRVTFVGVDVYEAAGGKVIHDLFEEDGGYLADTALLNRLVREKLQKAAEAVMAEGWKWGVVDPEFDYQRVASLSALNTAPRELSDDDQKTLDSLQEQLQALYDEAEQDEPSAETYAEIERLEAEAAPLTEEVFATADIARAGAFVSLGPDGDVRIMRGYLRPEDKGEAGDGGRPADKTAGDGKASLSAALVAELTAHRTMALRNDLAQSPELALIAVTHALVAATFYRGEALSCLEIIAKHNSLVSCASHIEESTAGKAIAERHQAWAARLPNEGADLWLFVASLPMEALLDLLAHCASLSLDAVKRPGSDGRALSHADQLAHAMPHAMSRYWQPTAANYLGRVSKELIMEAVREGAGEDAARQISSLKKQAMALRAEELLVGKGWLPAVLMVSAKGDVQLAA